jgi:SAM-dependent methyltransferase
MSALDPSEQRAAMLERWERGAAGWGRKADRVREFGMPVSSWLIEQLELRPGQRVLELAAGPGDTGFLAAELVRPGGGLVCSDATEAMLDVARARAAAQGIENVEFARLELEWIDLPTASVDAVVCRWGIMLTVDPAAAVSEMRRVLRPGGRVALAVWDDPSLNPWATTPGRALVELGFADPPDPSAPGMFALAEPGRLQELLKGGGFTAVIVESVELGRERESLEDYIEETLDLSRPFADVFGSLSDAERAQVRERIGTLAAPFVGEDGSVSFPARSLVAAASG